jgi:hypothetical protein
LTEVHGRDVQVSDSVRAVAPQVQNLRRDHHELGVEAGPHLRLAAAFDEFKEAI